MAFHTGTHWEPVVLVRAADGIEVGLEDGKRSGEGVADTLEEQELEVERIELVVDPGIELIGQSRDGHLEEEEHDQ
jgi:hypothetical protein